MVWVRLRWLGLVGALGIMTLMGRAASAQSTSAETVYRLHGTVVNGQTGQPIGRALVFSTDNRLATMTDSTGRFAIDVDVTVPQGNGAGGGVRQFAMNIMLMARKPGFEPQVAPLMVPVDESLSAKDVSLKLMPVGVIAGEVSTGTGDSARDVQVMLFRRQVLNGQLSWQPAGAHATNGDGEFRFGSLSAGEYTLATMPYRPIRSVPDLSASSTEQYAPVFYGDAPDLKSATKVKLHYGETVQTEVHLHRARYYSVTVAAAGASPSYLNVRVAGAERLSVFGYQMVREGKFEGSLPNGDYTLLISGGQPQGFAQVPIHVAGAPVQVGPVALAPFASVPVHVHDEFTGKGAQARPRTVRVMLQSEWNSVGSSSAEKPGHENDYEIEDVQPGRYTAVANPDGGYVASMTCGETDLLREPLVVGSGAVPPIEVVMRDDVATVKGQVAFPAGEQALMVWVFLLPESMGQMVETSTEPDGAFSFSGLAPGTYHVLASSSPMLQIPYRDAEAMRGYETKLREVTVGAGQTATAADVPLLDTSAEGTQ